MKCLTCGCTEERPCEGGCFWFSDNVCSQCVINQFLSRAMQLDHEDRQMVLDQIMAMAGELALSTGEPLSPDAFDLPDATPRLWRPGDPA